MTTETEARKVSEQVVCMLLEGCFVLLMISSNLKLEFTVQVDSLVVSSGERYDFWIEADDSEELGKYWIRAETLEVAQNGKVLQSHKVKLN